MVIYRNKGNFAAYGIRRDSSARHQNIIIFRVRVYFESLNPITARAVLGCVESGASCLSQKMELLQ